MTVTTLDSIEIIYPESDGSPMGETDVHIGQLLNLRAALRNHFRNDPQIYVAANMYLYYEKGDRAAVVAPDVFVVWGVSKEKRRTYKLWEEGQVPSVIFEISSRSTRLEDVGTKRAIYAMLGVAEYYIFDPYGEYLEPRLWAYRLDESTMELMRVMGDVVYSEALGLALYTEGHLLRLRDPQSGQPLFTMQEAFDAQRAEAQARQTEAQARQAAEAEVKRLQAELARLKSEQG